MRMSKLENAIRVVLEFNKACNHHDVPGMLQLMSEECLLENSGPAPQGAACHGREAIARYWEDFFRAAPQARFEIEEIYSLSVRCVMRWKYSAGDASTGQPPLRGVDLFQVQEGLICQQLTYIKGN